MPRATIDRRYRDLDTLTGKVWAALGGVEELLDHEDPAVRLKAAGTLAQLAGVYARLYAQSAPDNPNPFADLIAQNWASDPEPEAVTLGGLALERMNKRKR